MHNYIWASIWVSFAGMLWGVDTGIIGPVTAMPGFADSFGTFSPTIHGLIVSSILLPAAFTSFFAGHLADKVGRLNAISTGAAIFAVGATLEAGAVSLAMFIPGRALAGIGEGFFLSTVVVYICEICPPERRGPIASLVQLLTTLGIPTGYFVCYGSVNIKSSYSWRLPFILQAVFAAALACTCRFLPASPRWLIDRGHTSKVGPAMDRLQLDMQQFQEELESAGPAAGDTNEPQARQSYQRLLWVFREDNRKQAFLGMFLMGAMQFSGIDAVLYYAPTVFRQAGLSSTQSSFLASGITGIVIFVSTIPASFLSDNWGRRTSSLWGAVTMAFCMLLIGSLYASGSVHEHQGAARWIVIVTIYLFTISYSTTWSVGFKLYVSEIQPPQTRAAASSLAQSANWVSNFIVALITPIFLDYSSFGAYYLFGISIVLTGLVCLMYMPESRGKSLQTIHREFDESLHVKVLRALGRGLSQWGKKRGAVEVEEPKSTGSSISELSKLEKAKETST
ncbi:MAG: hypothetical protein L6R42_004602 [Xanthoria sp. 1 TBL-2021]|nr:MAG: hypothetical protein L6R42_004602 [Xanthoria sp. 1 TBL-2021]